MATETIVIDFDVDTSKVDAAIKKIKRMQKLSDKWPDTHTLLLGAVMFCLGVLAGVLL